ncbi:hypothetical protein FRB94_002408 [Tulasnella sp. JGI-2019a]|nr:hypothetical protein FRB94_002408 [Tulasnella sp. JGI-2019a]KAG9036393.1 hypothetical protein FRB95_008934 [Tulasnella sp. JGI-2019a]
MPTSSTHLPVFYPATAPMTLTPSDLLDVPQILLGTVAVTILYITARYFKHLNETDVHKLPTPSGSEWLWGHEMMAFVQSCGKQYKQWFDKTGPVYRIKGALGTGDIITTSDAAMINHIMHKNLYDYEKSPMIRPIAERLVGRGLVWAEGDTHKRQRALLNPAFTIENVRRMAPAVNETTERYINALETHILTLPSATGVVDLQEWTAKATLDIIGRVGFGHDFQLGSSPEAARILAGWRNQANMGFSRMAMVGMAFLRLFPSLSSAPVEALKAQERTRDTIKDIARSLANEARENMEEDGTTWGQKIRGATDVMSLLLKAQVTNQGLSEEELLDNIVSFVVAGHETTSGTLNYTLHELSKNPSLQCKLRAEINGFRASHGHQPTFDDYMNGKTLPLLDAVTKEALRKYPAAPLTERIATKDDVLPLRNPIRSPSTGELIHEIRIKKGQTIFLPVIAINRMDGLYGDGDAFRPERWMTQNEESLPDKGDLVSAGWNGTLVFSAGARLCIGYRLALFEYKALLAAMVQRFVFHDDKTELEFRHVGSLQPRVVGREEEGVQCPVLMSFADEE